MVSCRISLWLCGSEFGLGRGGGDTVVFCVSQIPKRITKYLWHLDFVTHFLFFFLCYYSYFLILRPSVCVCVFFLNLQELRAPPPPHSNSPTPNPIYCFHVARFVPFLAEFVSKTFFSSPFMLSLFVKAVSFLVFL